MTDSILCAPREVALHNRFPFKLTLSSLLPDSRIMGVSMRARIHQTLVSGLAALLIASVAAPGLTMHNCRQFGTRSTQLCACCEAELESKGSCCSEKSDAVTHSSRHQSDDSATAESSCCFTSVVAPFSFDGQSGSSTSVSAQSQHDLASASPTSVSEIVAPSSLAISNSAFNIRHSSDPPSYILTHSFRC